MTGQSIPSGLHVQLNLATGKREAKLLAGSTAKYMEKTADSTKSGIIHVFVKCYTV